MFCSGQAMATRPSLFVPRWGSARMKWPSDSTKYKDCHVTPSEIVLAESAENRYAADAGASQTQGIAVFPMKLMIMPESIGFICPGRIGFISNCWTRGVTTPNRDLESPNSLVVPSNKSAKPPSVLSPLCNLRLSASVLMKLQNASTRIHASALAIASSMDTSFVLYSAGGNEHARVHSSSKSPGDDTGTTHCIRSPSINVGSLIGTRFSATAPPSETDFA
mmetsp:Transcript_8502/g.24472  ORF Transcript_8502/g.24472 Transcript_8502/m.24472 type:complete len:221 (+) Transcript_8502:374-1036(+)